MHRAESHKKAKYYAVADCPHIRSRVAFTAHRAQVHATLSAWKLAGKDGRKPYQNAEYTPIVIEGPGAFQDWAKERHFSIDWETCTLIFTPGQK